MDTSTYTIAPMAAAGRLRLLESVVVNGNDAVLITLAEPIDRPGPVIIYCNAAFTRMTGYAEADVLGRCPRLLQSPDTDRGALDRIRAALTAWRPVEVELLNIRKDGVEFWVQMSIVPVADDTGRFTHWVAVQREVTARKVTEAAETRARVVEAHNIALEVEIGERKAVEARLIHTAYHDDLTGLYNRAYFIAHLTAALTRADTAGERCAVLFMDLDRFKLINDGLGHHVGDILLTTVAQRLRGCVAAEHTLARVGGDEFAIIVEHGGIGAAVKLAQCIIDTMRPPIVAGDREIAASFSIGVAEADASVIVPAQVLRDADVAMYRAKRFGAGTYAVFARAMHDTAIEALRLKIDLTDAVERNEFHLDYQPVCDAATGAIRGVEALLRWDHPDHGLVLPAAFIPVAEETGLIRQIGEWKLREACGQMRAWRDSFPGLDLRLGVNTSGDELRDDGFTARVAAVLAATGLEASALELEITESVFFGQPDRIAAVLDGIRALGVRVALDDFGTGFSSLSHLDQYPVDAIKIDRAFVARMPAQRRTMAVVETIIRLGRSLGLDVTADGVKSQGQLDALVAAGCESVQGDLLGEPMSPDAITLRLAKAAAGSGVRAARFGWAGYRPRSRAVSRAK